MLKKVEPADKGIPHFREVYLSDIQATGSKRAFITSDLKESLLENFHFSNVNIEAAAAGEISFASGWKFDKVVIKAKDSLLVKNSNGMINL